MLVCRAYAQAGQRLRAALGQGIKGADAVYLHIKEFYAGGQIYLWRENIQNVPAQGKLAFAFHQIHTLVSSLSQIIS